MTITYKKVGVDISEIKKSQKAIGRLIASTHKLQKKAKMTHGFGHYAGIVEIPGGKLLATHTDGVGTKVIIANMMKKFDTIGIDCVAMNVNDIIVQGAKPILFLDYISINKIELKKLIELIGQYKKILNSNEKIITTEKDFSRMSDKQKLICDYVEIDLEIDKKQEFINLIKNKL